LAIFGDVEIAVTIEIGADDRTAVSIEHLAWCAESPVTISQQDGERLIALSKCEV